MSFRLACLLLIAACAGPEPGGPPPEPPPVLIGAEDLATARQTTIATGPRLAGSLQPADRAALRAETSGAIVDVDAEVGQDVDEGELLARIEDPAAEAGLRAAEAGVDAARAELTAVARDFERTEVLAEAGALAERDVDVARTAVAAARARLRQAEAEAAAAREVVGAAEIHAPIDGVVSARAVGIGDIVAPGALLFEIVDPSSLRLEASVPAEALAALEIGAPVRFDVQGVDGTLTGHIDQIAPSVTPGARQIAVIASIPNPEGRLVAGLFAEGRVSTESAAGVVVPADAIHTTLGETAVMRVRDGLVERVPVETGLTDEDAEQVLITRGLAAGDVVLVGAAKEVEPGTRVRMERRTTEGPAAGSEG